MEREGLTSSEGGNPVIELPLTSKDEASLYQEELMEPDAPPHSSLISGMGSWGDEVPVVPATKILAPNQMDEALVLAMVSAPDLIVKPEIMSLSGRTQ